MIDNKYNDAIKEIVAKVPDKYTPADLTFYMSTKTAQLLEQAIETQRRYVIAQNREIQIDNILNDTDNPLININDIIPIANSQIVQLSLSEDKIICVAS